jgi:hypothetical protein
MVHRETLLIIELYEMYAIDSIAIQSVDDNEEDDDDDVSILHNTE